jgi:hypothetical protein
MEEFTNSIYGKIFYCAIAVGLILFSFFLFGIDHTAAGQWIIIVPIVLLALAGLIIAGQVKRKITISADRIVVKSVFGDKELLTENVKGCRIGEKTIYIEPTSAIYAKITINNYSDLGNSGDLVNWLKENFADLDAADLSDEQDKILHDNTLGFTTEERQEKLIKAKRVAIAYNITGAVVAAAAFFLNDIKLLTILLLAYPLLGILVMKFGNGLIKFVSNKKTSVYPFVFIGFYAAALMILIPAIAVYDIFDYTNIWVPSITSTLVVATLLYMVGINRSAKSVIGQTVIMVVLAGLYGFGGVLRVNCDFDHSKLQVFTASVLDRRMQTGKNNSYYLTLSPWGPSKDAKEVSVHKWLYNEAAIGSTVKVKFKTGLLNIPWFTVSD